MSDQKLTKPLSDGSTEQNTNQSELSRAGAEAIRKSAGFISAATGYKSIKKNISILKFRASFPLLRRMIKNELKTSKSKPEIVDALEISDIDRDRSYFWHTIIIAVTAPALIWSIFILTKALAIGTRFDVWTPMLNQGLYTSVPMIIFTASKLYISWHSRKAFKSFELAKSQRTSKDDE